MLNGGRVEAVLHIPATYPPDPPTSTRQGEIPSDQAAAARYVDELAGLRDAAAGRFRRHGHNGHMLIRGFTAPDLRCRLITIHLRELAVAVTKESGPLLEC